MVTIPMPKIIDVGFNPVFREVNASRVRYRVLKGGAGSGKSFNLAQDYILKLGDPRYKGANLLVLRKVDDSNKYSTYSELCGAVQRIYGAHWEKYWRIGSSPMMLRSLITGNEIVFRGMADIRQRERVKSISFASGKLCWIWCEEATEFEQEDVEILDDRLRGVLPNENLYYQITLSFNPVSSAHWIKRRFFDAPSDNTILCHSTYRDNRFCDAAYARRMEDRKLHDPEGYRIYGEGDWGETGGLILTRFVIEDFLAGRECFEDMAIGQDFGYNHANAVLLLGYRDGELYVCSEIYVFEKDTDEIVRMARERGLPDDIRMWCDSAEPDRIKSWRMAGYRRARGVEKEKNSVAAQIDWLKRRKIHIHPSCTNTIKEIQQWKWDKNKRTGEFEDTPVMANDDAMAALRYGVERWRKSSTFSRKEWGI